MKGRHKPHYENVPFEVPDGWVQTKIEDVCVFESGYAFSSESYRQDGMPLVRISNIKDGFIDLEGCVYVDPISDTRFLINKGDLLIAMSGATTGKMGIYNFNSPSLLNQRVGNIKSISNEIIWPEYRNLCLKSLESQILKDAYGGAQPNISAKAICSYNILLPPIEKQKRIVLAFDRLMAYVDTIENEENDCREIINKAKAKVLSLAIHGKLVPQDPTDETASDLLKRINPKAVVSCDNPHYENIPSSWICTTMGSLFQHNTGKALNKSSSVEGTSLPYLTTSNVYWNTFDLSVVKEMRFKESEIEKCTVIKGDLLVCEGGDIGRSAIWDKDYSICIQNHLHRLRPKGNVVPLLYLYFIMYLKLTNNLEGKGIGLQGFSSGLLDKLEVPLPPYNEQIRVVNRIQETFNLLNTIAESLK